MNWSSGKGKRIKPVVALALCAALLSCGPAHEGAKGFEALWYVPLNGSRAGLWPDAVALLHDSASVLFWMPGEMRAVVASPDGNSRFVEGSRIPHPTGFVSFTLDSMVVGLCADRYRMCYLTKRSSVNFGEDAGRSLPSSTSVAFSLDGEELVALDATTGGLPISTGTTEGVRSVVLDSAARSCLSTSDIGGGSELGIQRVSADHFAMHSTRALVVTTNDGGLVACLSPESLLAIENATYLSDPSILGVVAHKSGLMVSVYEADADRSSLFSIDAHGRVLSRAGVDFRFTPVSSDGMRHLVAYSDLDFREAIIYEVQ